MDEIKLESSEVDPAQKQVVALAVEAIKQRLRFNIKNEKWPDSESELWQEPQFLQSDATVVYREIVDSDRLIFAVSRPQTIVAPGLVEEFADYLSDNASSEWASAFLGARLAYVGIDDTKATGIVPKLAPRARQLFLENTLVLETVEWWLANGGKLEDLDDETIERFLDQRFHLAERLLPAKLAKVQRMRESRQRTVVQASRQVEQFAKQFRVVGIENGVGSVPPRETFRSSEAYQRYLGELATHKNSPELANIAPSAIWGLVGKTQYDLHGGLDAFDHTLSVCRELNVDQFGGALAEYLRVAAWLHDTGKSIDPLNVAHAYYSEYLAKPILEKMGYPPWEQVLIGIVIRYNDGFGLLMKGKIDPRSLALNLLPPIDSPYHLLDLIEAAHELARADITSMPWTWRGRLGTPKSEVLRRLEAKREIMRAINSQLEGECQTMDQAALPILVDERATIDTVVDLALAKLTGGAEIPGHRDQYFSFLIETAVRTKPELFGPRATAAEKVQGIATLLTEAAEPASRTRIQHFVAEFYLTIADALLLWEQRNLGQEAKVWLRKKELEVARHLLSRDWDEVVTPNLHGTSTFSLVGLEREKAVLASSDIQDQLRLIGEADLALLPKPGRFYDQSFQKKRLVYLTGNPAVARAYAQMNTAGEGYNFHPLYVAENIHQSLGTVRSKLREIASQAETDLVPADSDPLRCYYALETESRRLYGLAERARNLAGACGAMEFSVKKLNYIATLPPDLQRELLEAGPVILAFFADLPTEPEDESTGPNWLEVKKVRARIDVKDLAEAFIDTRHLERWGERLRSIAGPGFEIWPTQALDIWASIVTQGQYDVRYDHVYNSLRHRPRAKLVVKA